MTQAYNLSQLANKINTSGELDASTALVNTVPLANGGTNALTAAQAVINLGIKTGATGSEILPVGTTAQRDVSPASGYIRFNSDLTSFEGYNGSAWGAIGAGATGGGTDQVFYENGQNVTASYTITSGKNAMSAGPITINDGVNVTVPDNSTWVIV